MIYGYIWVGIPVYQQSAINKHAPLFNKKLTYIYPKEKESTGIYTSRKKCCDRGRTKRWLLWAPFPMNLIIVACTPLHINCALVVHHDSFHAFRVYVINQHSIIVAYHRLTNTRDGLCAPCHLKFKQSCHVLLAVPVATHKKRTCYIVIFC